MLSIDEMPRYEAYKESGADYSGLIPDEWKAVPIRAIFDERNEKNTGPKTEFILSVTRDRGVIPYDEKGAIGNNKSEDIERYKLVYENDLVINKMNVVIGSLGLSKYFGALSQVYIVLKPKSDAFHIGYYTYLFRNESFYRSLIKYCTGIMELRESLNRDQLKQQYLPFPSVNEQSLIVQYLDKKTAQIDEAIAIKEQQISLLKERKQIIIQKAVTQGLNPNVQMKDSGVDWLGNIPKHWQLKRLKYVTKILKRIIGYEGPDVLSITQKGIKIKDITSGEGQLAMDYSKYQVVRAGDFAMNHMDLLTGYGDISKYEGVVSPDYRVFVRTHDGLHDEYLLTIFQLGYQQKIFYRYGQGVSLLGRWRFPADNFNNFYIPIPPKDEQKLIVSYISKEMESADKGIEILLEQIARIQEYKTTLINSAVTGKIKIMPEMAES